MTPFSCSTPVIPLRGVHLDLKGTPPTFPRLLQLLDLFAALRYTTVFVEWEDAFPWSVDPSFRSPTAYSEEEVRRFAARAEALGLELVPLVQTIGHMENFLKGEKRAPLRAVPDECDVINPLAPGASEFVSSLVLDVMRLMPNIRRFHLGGDEAKNFDAHPSARHFVQKHGSAALYLHHIEPILDLLNKRSIRPLLWHDMMIHWDDALLCRLRPQCDLVVWGYDEHPDEIDYHYNSKYIARFAKLGFTLWGGTAFKGADGYLQDRPKLPRRRRNCEAWLEVAQRYGMTGLITTGWSRYSYNAPQCESIEACLDSLLEQAVLMHDGQCDPAVTASPEVLLADRWNREEAGRFAQIRQAADEFGKIHSDLWYYLLMLRSQQSVAQIDPARPLQPRFHRTVSEQMRLFEEKWGAYRTLLEPLIPGHWLDRYFAERDQSIRPLLLQHLPA